MYSLEKKVIDNRTYIASKWNAAKTVSAIATLVNLIAETKLEMKVVKHNTDPENWS